MGSIRSFTCPHCGAPLPPLKKGKAVCEFCGSTVKAGNDLDLDNARQLGQEFERGRYDAQNSIPGADLAKQIQVLIKPVSDLHQTNFQVNELKTKLDNADAKLKEAHKSGQSKEYLIPLLILLIFFFLFDGVSIMIPLMLALLSYVHLHLKRRRKLLVLEKAASAVRGEYTEASAHLQQLYDTYNFDLIPEDYREVEPMSFFVKALNSGRAVSLTQAINLYEDDLHKKQMHKLQAEQNKLQAQQIKLQQQQFEEQQDFHERQLELSKKKGVDLGTVLTAAGSVAAFALTVKRRKR